MFKVVLTCPWVIGLPGMANNLVVVVLSKTGEGAQHFFLTLRVVVHRTGDAQIGLGEQGRIKLSSVVEVGWYFQKTAMALSVSPNSIHAWKINFVWLFAQLRIIS